MVSSGPPLLTAITGNFMNMASMGTIPKCSLLGVYNKHVEFFSRKTFSSSLNEHKNTMLSISL